jgi:hypothetical protein
LSTFHSSPGWWTRRSLLWLCAVGHGMTTTGRGVDRTVKDKTYKQPPRTDCAEPAKLAAAIRNNKGTPLPTRRVVSTGGGCGCDITSSPDDQTASSMTSFLLAAVIIDFLFFFGLVDASMIIIVAGFALLLLLLLAVGAAGADAGQGTTTTTAADNRSASLYWSRIHCSCGSNNDRDRNSVR